MIRRRTVADADRPDRRARPAAGRRALHGRDRPDGARTGDDAPARPLIRLQRQAGNRAVRGLVQTRLRMNEPGDPHEREADRVASRVMRMPDAAVRPVNARAGPDAEPVLRRCPDCGGTCAGCSHEDDDDIVRVQRKEAGARSPEVAPDLRAAIADDLHGGRPLPPATRSYFEPRFGRDFGDVRVHTGSAARRTTAALGARAFTVSNHIWLGQGEDAGRSRLLAHELTHVVQQGAGTAAGVVQRQEGGEEEAVDDEVVLTFPNGHVERRRVVRICNDGVLHFEPEGHAHMSAFRSIAFDGGEIRPGAVTAELLGRFFRTVGLSSEDCGSTASPPSCACDPSTRDAYDSETFRFIGSIRPLIENRAGAAGVPPGAVAGAIADEYDTRRGVRTVVDGAQDAVVDSLPEFAIDVDRFFDIHAKLLNTLENDVGPANIKVRTALDLVRQGELSVPGSPPSDIQVNRIVDFLLTEQGTVEAAVAVIRRAQDRFGGHLGGYPDDLEEAVLMEYYKQGQSYYERFERSHRADPGHRVCPGDDGCQFMYNRSRIQAALTARPGTVRTGPGTTMIVPDVEAWRRATRRRSAFE